VNRKQIAPLLVSAALIIFGLFMSPAWADDYRLDKVAVPLRQQVTLQLDPAQDSYRGEVNITLDLSRPSATLQFNGLDYSVTQARISGSATCALAVAMNEHGVVTATCPTLLPKGRYQLAIAFTAPFNRKSVGLYKTIDHGEPYLFTQFEMTDARRAFPVFDEPQYKIPFQLTLRAPRALKVYANTEARSRREEGEWTEYEFAETLPISSYLVAFAVGAFEEVPVTGMRVPGRIITTRGKSALAHYAAQQMPGILAALEAYFGRPYPYPKLDAVAVPEFPYGAMENAGLITYREDALLLDATHASAQQKQRSVEIQAHEMAHQWFGDLVTMKWWNDLWLNEAFATWMSAKVTLALHPEFESNLSLPQNNVMSQDALLTTLPIRKPIRTDADIMDGLGLAYSKGSAVLGLVEQWVGEAEFRKGVRNYINTFAFRNAEAGDLWSALGKAARKDVPAVLQSFIEQSAYPLISVEQHANTLVLRQQRFVMAGMDAPAQSWSVPVNIKYGRGPVIRTKTVLLNRAQATLKLDFEPDWVYPDAGAHGYYRFALSDSLRDRLLANINASTLTAPERKSFVYQADALLGAGKIDGTTFFRMLSPFINDPHPRVVSAALFMVRGKRDTFVNAGNEASWSRYMQAISAGALARFGLSSRQGDAAGADDVRNLLIQVMGLDVGDAAVIASARTQAELFLGDASRVDASLIDSNLAVAAFHADEALYGRMKTVFETTTDPHVRSSLLRALSRVGDASLQLNELDYLLSDHVTAADLRYCFDGHQYTEVRFARMRQWVYQHYEELARKLPPFVVPDVPAFVARGCDLAAFNSAQAFFAPKVQVVPGFARTLEKTEENVRQCVNLKSREQGSVDSYLRTF